VLPGQLHGRRVNADRHGLAIRLVQVHGVRGGTSAAWRAGPQSAERSSSADGEEPGPGGRRGLDFGVAWPEDEADAEPKGDHRAGADTPDARLSGMVRGTNSSTV
jgi:hypothetical protein